MRQARVNLLTTSPFFGALSLRLKLVEDGTLDKPMSADGVSLRFSPELIQNTKRYSFEDVKALIALHVCRCMALHPYRRGSRKEQTWNRAGELATTPMLLDAGFRLPPGALYEDRFRGRAAEQVYGTIFEEEPASSPQSSPKGQQQDEAGSGASQVDDAPGDDPQDGQDKKSGQRPQAPSQKPASERAWQIAAMQAAMASKRQGALPGAAERILEEIRHPPLDWRVILRRFITQAAHADYRWTPPNRRYLSAGLYLPTLKSERLGEIVVAIDTSGSVNAKTLARFGSEINAIVEDTRPERVHVVYADSAVQRVDTFERDDTVVLQAQGGGGTDFRPVFEWVDTLDNLPSALVYLTDMQGTYPEEEPSFPVLWAASEDYPKGYEPTCGEVVKLDI